MSIENRTLDCQNCGKVVSINEMYSCDACSEECQDQLLLKAVSKIKQRGE